MFLCIKNVKTAGNSPWDVDNFCLPLHTASLQNILLSSTKFPHANSKPIFPGQSNPNGFCWCPCPQRVTLLSMGKPLKAFRSIILGVSCWVLEYSANSNVRYVSRNLFACLPFFLYLPFHSLFWLWLVPWDFIYIYFNRFMLS